MDVLKVSCKLTFSDGKAATGTLQARSAGVAYEITYGGATERLDNRPEKGTVSDLELIFRMAAERQGAMLNVERSGEYESRTTFLSPSGG
jgi:hypothetical protein